jgi:lysophospholipase L1-like esterase
MTVATTTQAATGDWVGTWSVSPQSSQTTFQQQTLRQIVHTSISGTSARIQLSNRFGNQAVQVSNVHIAERSSGSSIVASSARSVTFGGQGSVTIVQGQVAISDEIDFEVPALSDVVISFYLPAGTGFATSHGQGTQTNYIAAGDVAGNTDLAGPQTTGSYYFLANLDVQNPDAIGAVVTLGASITDGSGSSQNANRRWPNDLAVRLVNAGIPVGVLNQGISGNRLLVDGAGQSATNRFDRDVISQPGVRWVIFSDDPINDLGNGATNSAPLIAAMTQLISSAHAAGLKFLCSTLTPFEGAGYWSQAGETGRQEINAFIRGPNSNCDGIVDQDTATHDPTNPTKFLPAYDTGDHLHPNEAGLQAIADAVDLGFFTVEAPDGGVDSGSIADSGTELDSGTTPEDSGITDSGVGGASGGSGGGSSGGGGEVGNGGNGGSGGLAGNGGEAGSTSGGASGESASAGTGGTSAGGVSNGGSAGTTGGAGGNTGGNSAGGNAAGGTNGNPSGGASGGVGSDGGQGTTPDLATHDDDSGCSCRTVGESDNRKPTSGFWTALACLSVAVIRRRRRS